MIENKNWIVLITIWTIVVSLFFSFGYVRNGSASQLSDNGPELWAARHDSPGGDADVIHDMVIDPQGNIYVTGASQEPVISAYYDYLTIKYSPNGTPLWVNYYNGPAMQVDEARAIGLDALGNVYVTGRSSVASWEDIVTLKYAPDGTLLWERYYDGPAEPPYSEVDQGNDLVVSGNRLYIAGKSDGPNGYSLLTLLSYDLGGTLLWDEHYEGGEATSLMVDDAGAIYMVGTVYDPVSDYNFVTIKYAPDGTRLWDRIYDGPEHLGDAPVAAALDGAGNIYVTGPSVHFDQYTYSDFTTIKYAPDGTELWARRYSGPAGQDTAPRSLVVDDLGYAYVGGTTYVNTDNGYDFELLKYDPDGNLLWERRFKGPGAGNDSIEDLYLDHLGFLYVTGSARFGLFSGEDFATLKYSPEGEVTWIYQYDGPNSSTDVPAQVAVDSAGNVIVAGTSQNDYLTIKYPPAPELFITVDDVFLAEGSGEGDPQIARIPIRLYQPAGYDVLVDYSTRDGSATAGSDYLNLAGTVTLPAGESSITLEIPLMEDIQEGEGIERFFLDINYASNAVLTDAVAEAAIWDDDIDQEVWAARYDGPDGSYWQGTAIDIDNDGNVYIAGTMGSYQSVLLKYGPSGNQLWVQPVAGTINDQVLDEDGYIYLAGGNEDEDLLVAKFDRDGNQIWSQTYDGPISRLDLATGLVLNPDGGVYVLGEVAVGHHPLGFEVFDLGLLSYDQDGNLRWLQLYDGPTGLNELAGGIGLDSSGEVFVAGTTSNFLGGNDFLVVKYNHLGEKLWEFAHSYPFHPEYINIVYDVSIDTHNAIYLIGEEGTGINQHGSLLKLSSRGTLLWEYHGFSNGRAVTGDLQGNALITGFTPEGMLNEKYAPHGALLWYDHLPGTSYYGFANTADRLGNSYATGTGWNDGTGMDYITMMYDPEGNRLWKQHYHGAGLGTGGADLAYVVAVDSSGNVYVTGESDANSDPGQRGIATVKYAATSLPVFVSVNDARAIELEGEDVLLEVTVHLSRPNAQEVILDYQTINGTATAGADFGATAGSLTIPAGSIQGKIPIQIHSDGLAEQEEIFFLNLSELSNAYFKDSQATGMIFDDGTVQAFLPLIIR